VTKPRYCTYCKPQQFCLAQGVVLFTDFLYLLLKKKRRRLIHIARLFLLIHFLIMAFCFAVVILLINLVLFKKEYDRQCDERHLATDRSTVKYRIKPIPLF